MPAFPKPTFEFAYVTGDEIAALREYRDNKEGRSIPEKRNNRVLVATWNIANLGVQERRDCDYQILAEIVSWFDIVALQEVHDDLRGLRGIQKHLPSRYHVIFSDKAGNNERMAFLFDSEKPVVLEKVGEVAVPPKDHKYIRLPGIDRMFSGFDRNPYLVSFKVGDFKFVLVNAHFYFGEDTEDDRNRRSLEAYATARWSDLRRKSKHAYVDKILVLGDFNLPKVEPGDHIYTALRRRGLRRPEHSARIGSNIANDKDYDQIMFFPGQIKAYYTGNTGIFDFDGALFKTLWEELVHRHGQKIASIRFRTYLRYYISDHRPLWAEFQTQSILPH
jgi:endonuclease/exonuclease/phosphatase family metal-dependent hydrolase